MTRDRLSAEELALQHKIDEILWLEWDPIGVNDEPLARSEYESYVLGILGLALNWGEAEEIAERLYWIETNQMGLTGNRQRCRDVARLILEARAEMVGRRT